MQQQIRREDFVKIDRLQSTTGILLFFIVTRIVVPPRSCAVLFVRSDIQILEENVQQLTIFIFEDFEYKKN